MKNKIIALFLVVVMATLALASCSKPYNYAEDNMNEYLEIVGGIDGLKAKLQAIEIVDGSFTTNKETGEKKVAAAIYSSLATYAEKNGEKNTTGKIDINDTLYYAYYITYKDANDVEYVYNVDEYMAETSAPKSSIKLSAIDTEDEKADKLSVAIWKLLDEKIKTGSFEIDGYKTNTTKDTKITKDFKSVVVSYTRTHNVKTDEGEKKQTSLANAVKIDLHAEGDTLEAKLAKLIVDNNATIFNSTNKNYLKVNDSTTFTVKDGETDYEYSNFKIIFAVENEGEGFTVDVEEYLSANVTLSDSSTTKMDNLHNEGASVVIPKEAKLTYHIFPVYYYSVSDIDARSIILEVLGSGIKATSLDIFSDEGYKSGDKTLKALVEELVTVYTENTTSKISELKTAFDKAEATLTSAKEKLDAAKKAVEEAGDAATDAQKNAVTTAQSTYDAALTARDEAKTKYETAKGAAAKKVDEIIKVTKEGDTEGFDKAVVKEYTEDQFHTMKEAYNEEILDKLAVAIWKLIDTNVVLKDNNAYPAELVEEAKAHLYNQYEYKFHTANYETEGSNGTTTSTDESLYSHYNGDFDAYLIDVTGAENKDGIDAKIDVEAKEAILPIMKIYAVAKALDEGDDAASKKMPAQVEENKFRYLEEDGSEGTTLEVTRYFAENFYLDDDAFEGYKEIVGKKDFENSVEYYGGETNIRAAMQFTNIFDYLLMARYEETGEGDDKHPEVKYVTIDGVDYLDLYNIKYKLVEKTETK